MEGEAGKTPMGTSAQSVDDQSLEGTRTSPGAKVHMEEKGGGEVKFL